ncbi:MAG: hypothetical protein PHG66_00705 [Candidatus Colwellbacteria bacterium]|nr:hypothetical protein [Candidatus Colwellbacteria bacterium]
MSDYCRGCCYESMFNCGCGSRICRYSHCGRVYDGPWPSYVDDDNKYLYVCCHECGQKYANEVEIERHTDVEAENERLTLENKRLRDLLILHKIDFDEKNENV